MTVTYSSPAISRLERPSAASRATRISLGVSASTPVRHGRRGGAGRPELVADPGGQRPGAAASRELERPAQRVPGRGALTVPAQGRPEFGQRPGALEQRGGVVERGRRLAQQGQAFRAAAGQPGHPQRDPERARRAEYPHVGQFGVGQPDGVLARPRRNSASAAPARACT